MEFATGLSRAGPFPKSSEWHQPTTMGEMAWAGVKPAGAAGQWESKRAGGSVSAKRNAFGCVLQWDLCDLAHASVMVVMAMMMKPEVPIVAMMMAIVMMVVAAGPAIGVEHS